MWAQWGHFLLCLALTLSVWQILSTGTDLYRRRAGLYTASVRAAYLQLASVVFAFGLLSALMMSGDYSLPYVVAHTNDALPLRYKFAAVWGAHEGSMLLWILILTLSSVMSLIGFRHFDIRFRQYNILVLAWVNLGTIAYVLLASNPFNQILPPLSDGRDLNPLLQDPGLIFHPPLLYLGYVSTVVLFAATVAALSTGRLNREWALRLRPFALWSWIFLGLGIALGSYWAYYELGWGGWWFWDPVENASFMPWLLLTALIHALLVAARSGVYLHWCALLAISAFGMSLLGGFLVRSGVLVSVHSFASDPERGIIILGLLMLYLVPALVIFALKAPLRYSRVDGLSVQSAILLNNLFICAGCATVLLGTLYPLILEVWTGDRISVGAPYFNSVFVPIMAPVVCLCVFAGLLSWRSDSWQSLYSKTKYLWWGGLSIFAALFAWGLWQEELATYLFFALGLWLLTGTIYSRFKPQRSTPESVNSHTRSNAMHLAHAGLAVFVMATALTGGLSVERKLYMQVGDRVKLNSFHFILDRISVEQGPNYDSTIAQVSVLRENQTYARLFPQRRRYHSQPQNPMTEAAIDSRWFGDVFVSLTGSTGERHWSMVLAIKPAIYWIWIGVMMMAGGGVISLTSWIRKAISARRER